MKIFKLYLVLTLVSACSNPTESKIERSKKNFDEVMNEASNLCLGKGYKGHEPEYRGCVISKASQILNIQVESSILGK